MLASIAISAKRRGVFKVETIGDCYVAVTGIPTARADHAVAMAKFARDMLSKLDQELHTLADGSKLGAETLGLAMRVGLHSGPVTAGVLRGEKARFQLFGDSVNTAARIESNGKANRIHASESTAALLVQAGKSHWVVPREDPIFAKGKGEMKTFWIQPHNNQSVRSSSENDEENCDSENGEQTENGQIKLCVRYSLSDGSKTCSRLSEKQASSGQLSTQSTLSEKQASSGQLSAQGNGSNNGEDDLSPKEPS